MCTLTAFGRLSCQLEKETGADFLTARAGTTDSELIFLWLMSRLASSGIGPTVPCRDPRLLIELIRGSLEELATRNDAAGASMAARLNCVLTDGSSLAAARWGNSLYLSMREDAADCGICGRPHVDDSPVEGYRAAAVASEPLTPGDWAEIPERCVVLVTPTIEVVTESLG